MDGGLSSYPAGAGLTERGEGEAECRAPDCPAHERLDGAIVEAFRFPITVERQLGFTSINPEACPSCGGLDLEVYHL